MNHTPEQGNQYMPKMPEPPCTWCVSAHVANIACKCHEPCGVGWCSPPGEDFLAVRFL